MPTIAMSGADTIKINNRVLTDLADGNSVELTYPNDIASAKTGKNGNSIFSLNESGRQADIKIRLLRGSADDKFLNGLQANQQLSFASTVLLIGEFIKKIGDGTGKITNDTYVLSGGIFNKAVEAKSNAEGDSEQSISIYSMKFTNSPRSIG